MTVTTRAQLKKRGTNGTNGVMESSSSPPPDPSSTTIWLKWLMVAVAFVLFASVVYFVWSFLPSEERDFKFFPPWAVTIEDAKGLSRYLRKYTENHYMTVVCVYVTTYIFLQTFAIPGSIFLSLMAGSLFETSVALTLVCCSAAVGATLANHLSHFVGRELVEKYQAERLASWRAQVQSQRNNMMNYMLFVRVTPLIPNFFVNIAAPHVGVPLNTFFWGTFFGVAPPSLLFVRAGHGFDQMVTTGLPLHETALLFVLGIVAVVPVFWKDWLSNRMLASSEKSE